MKSRMHRVTLGMLVLAGLAFGPLLPAAQSNGLAVRLEFKSSSRVQSADLASLGSLVIMVEPFKDARADVKRIGVNVEETEPVPVVTASDVGAFCAEAIGKLLLRSGVNVGTQKPTRALKGEVRQFFVTEGNTYEGVVEAHLSVYRVSDNTRLFEGTFKGTSSRWGRSLKAENYQETLSEAVHAMLQSAAADPGFINAMK